MYGSVEAIAVVWENCVGVYTISGFLDGWASAKSSLVSPRLVVLPIFVSSLSETIAWPIAFSLCELHSEEITGDPSVPRPLTILARSRHYLHLTVQTVLSAL